MIVIAIIVLVLVILGFLARCVTPPRPSKEDMREAYQRECQARSAKGLK